MNGYRAGALALLLAGLAVLAYAVSTGQAQVGLFLVFPFVTGSGLLPFAAMLLLFGAFVLWSVGTMRAWQERADASWESPAREAFDATREREARRETKSGGVLLLGPIPIVWGSDRRILPWMVGVGLLMLVLALLLTLRLG